MKNLMHVRLLFALVVAVALAVAPGAAAAHDGLPPGVHEQAHSLMADMEMHMVGMGMSEAQMAMMMADMEMMATELPPGTFLALLRLMTQADHESMMELHQFVHGEDLGALTPGGFLAAAQQIVRR